MTATMRQFEQILRAEGSLVPSKIDGLSDLLWSMGARTISSSDEVLIKWFHSKVPAFDNCAPMDILKEDGEIALFRHMQTIPC